MAHRMHARTLDLLRLVVEDGPMTVREAALGCVPPMNIELARAAVKRLVYMGYLDSDKQEGSAATYCATLRGRQRLDAQMAEPTAAPYVGTIAPPRDRAFGGTYDGAELRPFEGRPGAMDFKALPSGGISI